MNKRTEDKIRRRFHEGCANYQLLENGDRILIALSGGKDSLMLARLLAAQARLHRPHISVEAAHVIMDNIPYETDRSYLQSFCDSLSLPLHIIHSRFDDSDTNNDSQNRSKQSIITSEQSTILSEQSAIRPGQTATSTRRKQKTKCFLCSWNRRKALFRFATDNGFNKLALGHHQDDILVTWLMNMTFEGSATSISPKMVMRNYPIEVIRPLCLVQESWISEIAEAEGFQKQKTPCPYEETTRRNDMTDVFHHLQSLNPEARYCLWRALSNISSK